MKYCFRILLFILGISLAHAQEQKTDSKPKKIGFSNVSVVSPTDLVYKTLNIRYEQVTNKSNELASSDGGQYKWFRTKKEAVDFFERNKETADKETIYIVDSGDKNRKPEALTFKVESPKKQGTPTP